MSYPNILRPHSATGVHKAAGAVIGVPRILVRIENLALCLVAIIAYRAVGGSWPFFAALFLVPDLSMAGYLKSKVVGARFYNAGHSYIGPGLLGGLAWSLNLALWADVALIWCAHIGADRFLGYGLKYAGGFGETHLGMLGGPAVGSRLPGRRGTQKKADLV